MIDFSKPLYARIFDWDEEYFDFPDDGQPRVIVRKVEKIEMPCQHHDNPIIWYSNGLKSEAFELMEQEAAHETP